MRIPIPFQSIAELLSCPFCLRTLQHFHENIRPPGQVFFFPPLFSFNFDSDVPCSFRWRCRNIQQHWTLEQSCVADFLVRLFCSFPAHMFTFPHGSGTVSPGVTTFFFILAVSPLPSRDSLLSVVNIVFDHLWNIITPRPLIILIWQKKAKP